MESVNSRNGEKAAVSLISVKSKFRTEYRRFSVNIASIKSFLQFVDLLSEVHNIKLLLTENEFTSNDYKDIIDFWYLERFGVEYLPINNESNYQRALSVIRGLFRVFIVIKGDNPNENNSKRRNRTKRLTISTPIDFRRIAGLLDTDCLPGSMIRVCLIKHETDRRHIGLYIRSENNRERSFHVGNRSYIMEKPKIFVSRVVPGSIAESTGLIFVDDEILEVNNVAVDGKSIDQVADMMLVNSKRLVLTIRSTRVTPKTPPLLRAFEQRKTPQSVATCEKPDDGKSVFKV